MKTVSEAIAYLKSVETPKVGDKVTITGFGIGKKGQLVVDGVAVRSKRKCQPVKQAQFVITKQVTSGGSFISE